MAHLRLAPINTGLYVEGKSNDINVRFFKARAANKIELCMVGNISTSTETAPNKSTGIMSTDLCWRTLASEIKKAGSIPAIQLSATLPGFKGQKSFIAEDANVEIQNCKDLLNAVSKSQWEQLRNQIMKAVDLSRNHGFEHIQLHAAHGYAFSIALDPYINPNGIGKGVLESLMEYISKRDDVTASIRISWRTGLNWDSERQEVIHEVWHPFRTSIELDISNGYYNIDKRLIYPSKENGEIPFLMDGVVLAKRYPEASFIISGNVRKPQNYFGKTPNNLHFAMARTLIANPRYLLNERNNEATLENCDDCGTCHYYSRGASSITCSKWKKP